MADTEAPAPPVTFKKRSAKPTARKRPATPPPASSAAQPDSADESSSDGDEAGPRGAKRRRTAGIAAGNTTAVRAHAPAADDLKATEFSADRSTTIAPSGDATRAANWFDEQPDDLSSKALLGSSRFNKPAPAPAGSDAADAQTSQAAAAPRIFGPVKAPNTIRTVTVTDFAPDVCKDYKQTGFCGFGDSCKFLHAREDYKQGWQLDREWESAGKKKGAGTVVSSRDKTDADERADADDEALEKIPFACVLCREPYKSPVVTKCGHYFCEKCALARYRKNPTCAICGGRTDGIFNSARGLKKLLNRKRERIRRRKQAAREAGEDVSDDDDAQKVH